MTKTIKVAFQIDELHKLNFKGDSSYLLLKEAVNLGLEVYFYYPKTLAWQQNEVFAHVYKVLKTDDTLSIPIVYESIGNYNLENMKVIWLRQDPPFDMGYITSTFLLEKLVPKVAVYNHPISVRNSPEKLLVTNFSHLMPKTLVSSDFNQIDSFAKIHGKCVIKPLYGNAGSDVFFLDTNDFNYKSIIQYFLHTFKEQIMVQQFIENVKNGDKRIILINGEPKAYFNRVPAKNEIKSNLAAGGTAHQTTLTQQEKVLCDTIAPTLRKLGLYFVGIDVIDGFLNEINVTSPTGLVAWKNITGENLANFMWKDILKNL